MPRWLQKLRILKSILALSKDPERTDDVFFIGDAMLDMLTLEEVKKYSAQVLSEPGFKELYEEQYVPDSYDVGKLSAFPEGTLAHQYGIFMRTHGYSSEWYPKRSGSGRLMYLRNRLLQTHDILHTVTGFGGSAFGEIAVQAFYLAQLPGSPLPAAILAATFLHALNVSGSERTKLMEYIVAGYEMGKKAQPILFRKWENDWNQELSSLRKALLIEPFMDYGTAVSELHHSFNRRGTMPTL